MISPREIQHIAKLARISLKDAEILAFQKDLGSILEYFEILREIDSASPDTLETSLVSALVSISREDATKMMEPTEGKRLLEMAPEAKDGYAKVKSIL